MRRDTYPEWKPWQQACRVCERVKCPKPEAVGEWLEKLVGQLHALMHPDLKGAMGWRWQAANYEALLECFVVSWSWSLRGVCPDCIKSEDPEMAAHLGRPDLMHFDAMVRWSCLSPSFAAVSLVRAATPDGLRQTPAVWRSGGLSVHPSVNFWGPGGWVVTHDRSGWAVVPARELDQATAVAMAELLSEVADWESLDAAEIAADEGLKSRVRPIFELLSGFELRSGEGSP